MRAGEEVAPVVELQPELVAVPTPTQTRPGRCRLSVRYGAERPCPNSAEGTAADWTAPLDPARRLGASQACADAYGLDLTRF